jgi:O-succinylbenzoic acid--CoA ligase
MPASTSRRLVPLQLPPGEEFVAALDAAWSRGDAVLPVDPNLPRSARDQLLAAMQLDRPADPGVALVILTSGSTGEPKGAQLTHSALEASARATHARIGIEPGDRWLACLPWHHIGGIQVLLRARLLDLDLVVHDGFEVDRFAASEATLTSLVPTQLARLLDAGVELRRFRAILLGGAPASAALLAKAASAGARVVTTYGMSETAGGCVYDGVPLDGVEVRIDADGRINVRGPVVMTGYRLRPDLDEAALADGWLRTADLGEIEPDGRLRVLGRADDVIVTGGEKVAAAQVASVLAAHPDVVDVAVTGVADPEWGQRVVAVVVGRQGAPALELSELQRWCSDRLGKVARPRTVVVVDDIPRLASGKPDRIAVTRLAEAASGDAGV